MRLVSYSVRGFRSLEFVEDIPVGSPTILAGPNDGGKTAVLDALRFLIGDYRLADDDRTYQAQGEGQVGPPQRCTETEVIGAFVADAAESSEYGIPTSVRVRRWADHEVPGRLEYWGPRPGDARLWDLDKTVTELRALARELGIRSGLKLKADLQTALREYARQQAVESGWIPLPSGLARKLPRLMVFDGKAERPDQVVASVLKERFQTHVSDEGFVERLEGLQGDVKDRLRQDAQSLFKHIQARCPDFADVTLEPQVGIDPVFRDAGLRIASVSGEPVGLRRSGLGRARRVALAVWEWASELLVQENEEQAAASDEEDTPLGQTIVVYDEPDTHLDYHQQRKIMALIREQASAPGVNVVVATHSMNLIDGVNIADVVNLRLDNGRSSIERLGVTGHKKIDDYLRRVSASVGLRNSILLHERCFLAVEGESELRAIPILFQLAEGITLQSAGIALWACHNNEGALHLAGYLARHDRDVMLMVDADSRFVAKGLFKEKRLANFLGTENVRRMVRFVGEPDGHNEFEELFEDDIWCRVANEVWPKVDSLWNSSEFAAHRGSGKFSKNVHEMLRNGAKEAAPSGKPDMMFQIACALESRDDIPKQLLEIFADLQRAAR